MNALSIIVKKRDGMELSREDIELLIAEYTAGNIPDYQMSAFLMSVYLNGLNMKETAYLTSAIADSGKSMDLSWIDGRTVDKHSTGGVGDKITLILIPLVASAGLPVLKLSGRGLGHTGGTLDKLESIKGYRADFGDDKIKKIIEKTGAYIGSASADLAPADKLLYALRDVTATVDCIPLIASSVMGKKIAAGCQNIVLDVKVGSGALTKNMDDAAELAETMVDIGKDAGRNVKAFITDMNQPLGHTIGNSLEVEEAINCLNGEGAADLMELSFTLGSEMLVMGGIAREMPEARDTLQEMLISGKAAKKFAEIINAQDGDSSVVEDTSKLPKAGSSHEIKLDEEGFISGFNTTQIGRIVMGLGAGRSRKEDPIDYSAGMILHKKIEDYVEKGEKIATIFYNCKIDKDIIENKLRNSVSFSKTPVASPKLIHKIIS